MKVRTFFRLWFLYITFQWKRYLVELETYNIGKRLNRLETSLYLNNKNPAHFCDCGKYLGHRGFCSDECHDKHYDAENHGNRNFKGESE